MADWFKFYNDGLDSKGMQFALTEQPLVTGVWLLILSEASKNRSSKIKWNDEDFELIGYARKLNISVPVFNQCVGLLERAKFIRRISGFIEIDGWTSLQSDYAKGLDKGYYKKTRKKLASIKEVSTVRREEKRVEEKMVSSGSEHGAFINGWCENYKSKFGVIYKVDGGKDGKAAKELLSMGILRIDLLEIAKKAWDKPANIFSCRQAQTIFGFRQYFNQIQVEVNYANKNSSKPNPRNDGIAFNASETGKQTAELIKKRNAQNNEPLQN